jgi:anaerobic magnesium-protoporphyrin IX monomethyl ester cyclase
MIRSARVLLLTPNWRWDETPLPVDTLIVPVAPPLEFAYLSAGLRPTADVRVVDAYASGLEAEQLGQLIADIDPTAVVVTTTPSLLYWRCPPMTLAAPQRAISIVRQACRAPVTIVGPHGTASPEWALQRTGADWSYRGAFERELPELLVSGDYGASDHIASADGRRLGRTSVLAARDLPPADFRWLDWDAEYPPHMWSVTHEESAVASQCQRGLLLEASRGCPWSCAYCAKAPVRDKFGRRPPEVVEAELDQASRLGADYVFFIDETFNITGPEFQHLLGLLRARNLRFGFQGRPDLITREIASQLSDAGCIYVELGIDTVSDTLSSGIGRRLALERALDGLQACRERIPLVRFNRLNLQTRDYLEMLGRAPEDWEYPPDPAFPYPGARLGDLVMQKYGYEAFDWDFARRYSWWLRIEVFLQRNVTAVSGQDMRNLQKVFLELPEDSAVALAAALQPAVQSPAEFQSLNKIVMRKGPDVRIRSARPQ